MTLFDLITALLIGALVLSPIIAVFIRARRREKHYRTIRRRLNLETRSSLVNSMTNWQRSQFARAGYPREISKVSMFARLLRRKNV